MQGLPSSTEGDTEKGRQQAQIYRIREAGGTHCWDKGGGQMPNFSLGR